MKKRLFATVLIIAICLSSVTTNVFAQTDSTSKLEAEITGIVVSYLEKSIRSIYFYETQDTITNTLLSNTRADKYSKETVAAISKARYNQALPYFADMQLLENGIESLYRNLELHNDELSYFGHVYETENIGYSWFEQEFKYINVDIVGDAATVSLYEYLDYQYSHTDWPTSEIIQYYITLMNIGGNWLIAAIESDDNFYQAYFGTDFDLELELKGFDDAWNLSENKMARNAQKRGTEIEPVKAESATAAVGVANVSYNASNATNYALTYSTAADAGSSSPSYRNGNFYWTSASCMLFASQSIWAGFGGSNTSTDVNAKQGMDASGSYTWWSVGQNTEPTSSWWSCAGFRTYVNNMKNSATSETGLICDTKDVAYNSDTLTDSTITSSDLKGSIAHVKGYNNGEPVALGHAVIITRATGSTRSTVFITAYNSCQKDKQFSLSYPSSTSDTNNKAFVIRPRTLRGIAPDDRRWATLQNAVVAPSTLTLQSYSSVVCPTLTTTVTSPSGQSSIYSKSNASSASLSYTLSTTGTWKVEVASSASTSKFTYIIRVV
jgi:hypothetical protein